MTKQETEGLKESVEAYKEPNFEEFMRERIFQQENEIAKIACKTPEGMTPQEWMQNEFTIWWECGKLSEQKFILNEHLNRKGGE